MATGDSSFPYVTFEAAGDLSAHLDKIMQKNTTARQVALATAITQPIAGVLKNKPAAAGRAATVQNSGRVKVIAGAAVTPGDLVTTDAAGLAIVIAGAAGTNAFVLGVAVTGAAGANEVIEVDVNIHRAQQ